MMIVGSIFNAFTLKDQKVSILWQYKSSYISPDFAASLCIHEIHKDRKEGLPM